MQQPLHQVAELFTGLSVARLPARGGAAQPVPFISIADLDAGRLAPPERMASLELRTGPHLERYRVQPGDVLTTCRGTQFKVALVDEDRAGAVANANLIVVRPGPQVLPRTLLAVLQSPTVQAELLRGTRSSAGTISLAVSDLGRLMIPVPPLDEQRRMVEFLEAVDASYHAGMAAAELRRRLGYELAWREFLGK
jgi:hypothetical protein